MPNPRARLDRILHGEPPTYTLADAAERTGVPADVIRRLWRSLGLALPRPDDAAFTVEDLRAIELMRTGSRLGVLDLDTEVRLVRALGQTMARLADWQVSTLSGAVDATADREARTAASLEMADALGSSYDEVLLFAWHRHLGAAVSRAAATADMRAGDEQPTVTFTVGFADLVSFSALSNELGDDRIGDLVEIFETRSSDVVTSLGGRVIKTLGDAVLFVADDPEVGMEIAMGIIDVVGDDPRLPDVRLGLATGPVLLRFGDVFGPPVNLAARLTAIARRNRVITESTTAGLLSERRYETRALTARPVRGFGVLEPVAVRRV